MRGVPPPSVGMGKVADPIDRGFVQHPRLGAGGEVFVRQSVDSAESDFFVQFVGFNLFAQVGAGPGPGGLLDNASIHIDDVEGAIRSRHHVYGPEQRVVGPDKLILIIRVGESGDAVLFGDFGASNQTTHRFGEE